MACGLDAFNAGKVYLPSQPRRTSSAAARSSSAVPTDLNSVIWLGRRAPGAVAAQQLAQLPTDALGA